MGHSDGVLEHLQRELEILASLPAGVAFAAKIEVVGLEIFGGLDRQGFELLRRKRDAEGFGDFAGDLVLNFEDIFHFAVEALGPERKIGFSVDKLGVDAEAGASAAQSAGKDIGGAELFANLRGGHRFIAKGQDGGARERVDSANFGELGDDVFGDAVAEVFVLFGAALIFEIEYGDGFGG